MTAENISLIAGALLSLAFSYIPGLKDQYAKLETETKRLVMLALVIVVAGTIYGLSCLGVGQELGIDISCNQAGLIGLLKAIILSAMANQSTYSLTKQE